jgi:hypothetical protein
MEYRCVDCVRFVKHESAAECGALQTMMELSKCAMTWRALRDVL